MQNIIFHGHVTSKLLVLRSEIKGIVMKRSAILGPTTIV